MRIKTLLFLLASTGVSLSATELIQNGDFQAPVFTGMGQSITFTDWDENGFGDANGSAASNLTPGGAYNQVLRLGSLKYARQDINVSWDSEHKFLLTFNAKEIWWRGGNTGDQVWVTIRDVSNNVYWATGKVNLDGTHTGGSQTDWVDMGGNASGDQSYRYVITGADLVAAGMTEGQTLRLNFANGGNSVIQMDNISLEMTVPNKGNFIFTGSQQGASAVTFPFESDFEVSDGYSVGPLYTDTWWQLDPGLDSSIMTPGAASPQALDFFGGEAITLFTDSGAAAISWVDFFIKPVYVDDEDLSPLDYLELLSAPRSTVTGFIRVQNNSGLGELYVADGSAALVERWVYTGIEQQLVGDTAVDWLRLTYRIDFTTKRWDLFVDDQMVVTDLGFLDTSITELSSFTIMSDDNDPTLLDYFYAGNSNPLFTDTSNDGLPDDWLIANGLDVNVNQRESDADSDGLVNLVEYQLGTSAALADTDGDWLDDFYEVQNGFDPLIDDVAGAAGFVPRDIWLSVGGNSTRSLTDLSTFPSGFDQRLWLTELAIPGSESMGNNYGQRIHGQLIAPETADYTFWIAGDNGCELWLSSDDAPFTKQLIASVETWTNYQQWEKFASQQSVTIPLQAGQSYYFEVIHKEISGGDHIAVAWAYGSTTRTVIDGQHLQVGTVHNNDKDDDGLPDHWERWQSLDDRNGSAENGFWGDPDGDGVANYLERLLGTNSKKVDTDGDGMNDLWEYENGLDPLVDDASDDLDGDGLTNSEESVYGTNPNLTDSDGDLLHDFDEVNLLGSDPLSDDSMNFLSLTEYQLDGINAGLRGAAYKTYGEDPRYYVTASGAGVESGQDRGHYVHRTVTGDFSYTVQLHSITGGNDPEFSIMLRESLSAGGNMAAFIRLDNLQSSHFFQRGMEDEGSDFLTGKQIFQFKNQQTWLRLVRKGSTIYSYASQDGISWYSGGTTDASELLTIELGVFASSGKQTNYSFAEFSIIELLTDADKDGIWDSEESDYGTSATEWDSDGDGYSDYEEINEFYSDPTIADLGAATTVASEDGSASFATLGDWASNGAATYAIGGRGAVEYDLNVTQAAIYRLNILGQSRFNYTGYEDYSIKVEIDGVYIGRISLNGVEDVANSGRILTPWLPAGVHRVRFFMDNTYTHRSLQVDSVSLEYIGGDDLDVDGTPDWMQTRLGVNNALTNVTLGIVSESPVSPFCLIGRSRYLGFSQAADPAQELQPLPSYEFYSDVELTAAVDTQVELQFENNAFSEFVDLRWVATDVLSTDTITIRKGDSLRLTALDDLDPADQAISITVDGGDPIGGIESSPVEQLFDTAGVYTVAATVGSLSGTLSVEVLEADLGDEPYELLINAPRTLTLDTLSAEAEISIDEVVHLVEGVASGLRSLSMTALESEPAFMAARLPASGAVLDHIELKPLYLASDDQTHVSVVETFEDGDLLISTNIVLDHVPDDLEVNVSIFVAGVIFPDGSIVKILTAEDFDELGRATIYYIMSANKKGSVCHRIGVSFGGEDFGNL